MKKNTWKYMDPSGNNRSVVGEPEDVVQCRAKALYSINMSCCEDIFNELVEITDPRAA
jgi:hypothetical protein